MPRLGRVIATRVTTVVVTAMAFVIGVGSVASARTPDTWSEAEPRSALETLGLFVGIPLGLFFLIVLLTMAGSMRREPRYRPDQEWGADPVWIGAEESRTTDAAGASDGAAGDGGGASARW